MLCAVVEPRFQRTTMLCAVKSLAFSGPACSAYCINSRPPYSRPPYSRQRGCLHDMGATFIPARVHSGSLLWLCIRLHDTNTKCHAGASHTGASSPRFLCRSEIFIPAQKFIPVSCKRSMTVHFISIKVSSSLRHYKA